MIHILVLCMAMLNGNGFNFGCAFTIEVAMDVCHAKRSACKIETCLHDLW
jgi:hypothetical protein